MTVHCVATSDGTTSSTLQPFIMRTDNADLVDFRLYNQKHKPTRTADAPDEYHLRQWDVQTGPEHPTGRRSKRPWPLFPRVEDELTSLAHEYQPPPSDTENSEASVRGEIDQLPIILEANPPTLTVPAGQQIEGNGNDSRSLRSRSSSESLGPHTPDSIGDNQDRRYVYIPEKGIEIPLTYDEPRTAKKSCPSNDHESERGRKGTPKLDTNLSRRNSPEHVPSPLERERSPYSYAPIPTKLKEPRFSGEYLLSPDVLSPKIQFREASHTGQTPRKADGHNKISGRAPSCPQHPMQASKHRLASAMAYPGEPVYAGSPGRQSSNYEESFDGSDDSADELSRLRNSTRPAAALLDPTVERPKPRFSAPMPQKERKDMSRQPAISPPSRALSAGEYRAPAPRMLLPTGLGPPSGSIPTSSLHINARRASPRGSPESTPHSSPVVTPPATPPLDVNLRKSEFQTTKRNTLPHSRSSSPAQAPPSVKLPKTLPVDVLDLEKNRPGLRSRQTSPSPSPGYDSSSTGAHWPRSSQTSPLPSPRNEGTGFEPGPRIDIREPSPASHHSPSPYTVDTLQRCGTGHASLLPSDGLLSPTLRLPETGRRRRASSNTETRRSISTNPVILQKAFESPQAAIKLRPLGPTRAVSVGPALPPTLPSCPRNGYVAGYDDWYTLVGFPSFAICPTCRDAVMIPGYAHNFTPRTPKPRGQKTRCNFGVPWMRMAWLMTLSQKRPDVNLLYAMAEVVAYEPPCPGKAQAVRDWYKINDPDTGRHVSNFNVCPYCVRNVETLFPVLRGVFYKSRTHHSAQERVCDLRVDSQRYSCYVDFLEETANQAIQFRRPPNTLRFVEFAKRMVVNQECPREDILRGRAWYIIPYIPEFTICEECYDLIVCRAIEQGSSLASQFTRKPQFVAPPHVGVSCQLYSAKMKNVFREACEKNDFQHLRGIAVQRHAAERNLQTWQAESQRYSEDTKADRLADHVREWRRWE